MRSLQFVGLLILLLGCNPTKNTGNTISNLNGTWIPVQQEFGGKSMPKESFEKQNLTLKGSTYIFMAESLDKGVVKYNAGKMDIYGKLGVNEGKHFTAIYKYENEKLTICYNLAGNSYPEAYDTKGKPLFFISVYVKQHSK